MSILERSGLAVLSDLEDLEWRELFEFLEREQASFLEREDAFRSPAYKGPRDPLHTWSRLWEYPYVFHHLQCLRRAMPENKPAHVVDFGSGLTFLPFSVAGLGFEVSCVDVDPVAVESMNKAAKSVRTGSNKVCALLARADGVPLPDAAADIVYCISVLEHVTDFTGSLREITRILRPGGHFILTTDVDLQGNTALGVGARAQLIQALDESFVWSCPDRTAHPADLLTSDRSRFPYNEPWSLAQSWFFAKQRIKGLMGRRALPHRVWLAVEGFVLRKRE